MSSIPVFEEIPIGQKAVSKERCPPAAGPPYEASLCDEAGPLPCADISSDAPWGSDDSFGPMASSASVSTCLPSCSASLTTLRGGGDSESVVHLSSLCLPWCNASLTTSMRDGGDSESVVPLIMGEDGEELHVAQGAMLKPERSNLPKLRPCGQEFEAEVLALSQEVVMELQELPFCAEASIEMSGIPHMSRICSIAATIVGDRPQESYQTLIQAAQESIYSRTSRGCGVCLLGYKHAPFAETQHGFVAHVGGVVRKRQTCRRLYQTGFCARGALCNWEHPADIIALNVMVAAAMEI